MEGGDDVPLYKKPVTDKGLSPVNVRPVNVGGDDSWKPVAVHSSKMKHRFSPPPDDAPVSSSSTRKSSISAIAKQPPLAVASRAFGAGGGGPLVVQSNPSGPEDCTGTGGGLHIYVHDEGPRRRVEDVPPPTTTPPPPEESDTPPPKRSISPPPGPAGASVKPLEASPSSVVMPNIQRRKKAFETAKLKLPLQQQWSSNGGSGSGDGKMGLPDHVSKMLLEERSKLTEEANSLRRENEALRRETDDVQQQGLWEAEAAVLRKENELLKANQLSLEERMKASERNVNDIAATAAAVAATRHHPMPAVADSKHADSAAAIAAASAGPADGELTLPRLLWEGGFLWKIPFRNSGTPHRRWFRIKPSESYGEDSSSGIGDDSKARHESRMVRVFFPITLQWLDPKAKKRKAREMVLLDVIDVKQGHSTAAFWQQVAHRGRDALPAPNLCFSLVAGDRTLDLAAETVQNANKWVEALKEIVSSLVQRQSGAGSGGGTGTLTDIDDMPPLRRGSSAPIPAAHSESEMGTAAEARAGTLRRSQSSVVTGSAVGKWQQELFSHIRHNRLMDVERIFTHGCPVDLMETRSGDTALLVACRQGQVDMVELCLRFGAKNDPHPEFGQTALQAAVSSGHTDCVRLLLETAALSNADHIIVNHEDPNKEAPLHVAARNGNLGCMETLLTHGANIALVDAKGRTCLHGASTGGHTPCVAFLLDMGADTLLDAGDLHGNTPLHSAARNGHTECVQLLLETAANPCSVNSEGVTPHQLATSRGHTQCCKLLKEYEESADSVAYNRCLMPGEKFAQEAAPVALPRPHTHATPATAAAQVQAVVQQKQNQDELDQQYSVLYRRNHPHQSGSQTARTAYEDHPGGVRASTGQLYGGRQHGAPLTARTTSENRMFDGLDLYMAGHERPIGGGDDGGVAHYDVSAPGTYDHAPVDHMHLAGSASLHVRAAAAAAAAELVGRHYGGEAGMPMSARDYARYAHFGNAPDSYHHPQHQQHEVDYGGHPPHHPHSAWDEHNAPHSDRELSTYHSSSDSGRRDRDRDRDRGRDASRVTHSEDESRHARKHKSKHKKGKHKGGKHRRKRPTSAHDQPEQEDTKSHGAAEETASWQGSAESGVAQEQEQQWGEPYSYEQEWPQEGGGEYDTSGYTRGQEPDGTSIFADTLQDDGTMAPEEWNIHYSEEGYQYFLHVASGYTQWEDPRGAADDGQPTYTDANDETWQHQGQEEALQQRTGGRISPDAPTPLDTAFGLRHLGEEDDAEPLTPTPINSKGIDGSRDPSSPSWKAAFTPPKVITNSAKLRDLAEEGQRLSSAAITPEKTRLSASGRSPRSSPRSAGSCGSASPLLWESTRPSASPRSANPNPNAWASPRACSPKASAATSSPPLGRSPRLRSSLSPILDHQRSTADDGAAQAKDGGASSLTGRELEAAAQDPALARFFKMRSMGIPIGAIQQKMSMEEGIDAKLIDAFADIPAPGGAAPPPDCAGIPAAKSEPKQAMGADSAADAVKEAKNNPALAKYFRMMSVGLPPEAVYHKMTNDGVGGQDLAQFKAATGGGAAAPPAPVAAAVPRISVESLKKDPKFARFFKMKQVGLPAGSIRHKMKQEGLSDEDITTFFGEAPQGAKSSGRLGPPQQPPTEAERKASRRRLSRKASVPMQKLHWNKLSDDKLQDSVWAIRESDGPTSELAQAEIKELEALFGAKPTKARPSTAPASNKPENVVVQLIDMKRSNNVNIGMAQFKPLSANGYSDLCRAISRLETTHLNVERLQNLLGIVPTDDEAKLIRSFSGDTSKLAKAEQFFRTLMEVPRLSAKIGTFLLKLQFDDLVLDLEHRSQVLITASDQLQNSRKLAHLLQKMLAVGNVMNEGTYKGEAAGFTLDSLTKIMHTRGADKKTSVLDYVARLIMERGQDDAIPAASEFGKVSEAQRYSSSELAGDLKRLKNRLDQAVTELQRAEDDADGDQSGGGDDQEKGSSPKRPTATGGVAAGGGAGGGRNAFLAQIAARGQGDGGGGGGGGRSALLAEIGRGKSGEKSSSSSARRSGGTARSAEQISQAKDFVKRARPVVSASQKRLVAVEEQVNQTMQKVNRLVTYFGEDPKICPSTVVFDVLSQLLAAFKRSTDAILRARDTKASPAKLDPRRAASDGGGSVKLALANAMAIRRENTKPVDGSAMSESSDSDSDWDDN